MSKKIRVTIWNEYAHEKTEEAVKALFPNGIHNHLAEALASEDFEIRTAALSDPECGLPDEVLNSTDVLLWWGHMCHNDVPDSLAAKVRDRVFNCGMGFIALHSAHKSKPFMWTVGGSGNLLWGDEQKEIIWNILPQHMIAQGIPESIVLDSEEMYGEPFMIPTPDELVFTSWFEHGNIFRSGCCYYRGLGKVFYFQPGHETCRSYFNPVILQIIKNAIRWAAPGTMPERYPSDCFYFDKLI